MKCCFSFLILLVLSLFGGFIYSMGGELKAFLSSLRRFLKTLGPFVGLLVIILLLLTIAINYKSGSIWNALIVSDGRESVSIILSLFLLFFGVDKVIKFLNTSTQPGFEGWVDKILIGFFIFITIIGLNILGPVEDKVETEARLCFLQQRIDEFAEPKEENRVVEPERCAQLEKTAFWPNHSREKPGR